MKKTTLHSVLTQLTQESPAPSKKTFSDLTRGKDTGNLEKQIQELQQVVDHARDRLLTAMPMGPSNGGLMVLLTGAPGTGKTHLGQAIFDALRYPRPVKTLLRMQTRSEKDSEVVAHGPDQKEGYKILTTEPLVLESNAEGSTKGRPLYGNWDHRWGTQPETGLYTGGSTHPILKSMKPVHFFIDEKKQVKFTEQNGESTRGFFYHVNGRVSPQISDMLRENEKCLQTGIPITLDLNFREGTVYCGSQKLERLLLGMNDQHAITHTDNRPMAVILDDVGRRFRNDDGTGYWYGLIGLLESVQQTGSFVVCTTNSTYDEFMGEIRETINPREADRFESRIREMTLNKRFVVERTGQDMRTQTAKGYEL